MKEAMPDNNFSVYLHDWKYFDLLIVTSLCKAFSSYRYSKIYQQKKEKKFWKLQHQVNRARTVQQTCLEYQNNFKVIED